MEGLGEWERRPGLYKLPDEARVGTYISKLDSSLLAPSKEEDMDLDEHHQRCILRGTWQLASVFHFLNVFRPVLHLNLKFSMEELESSLLVPNDLLGDIHIGLLKAIPPSIKNPINRETWIAALCKKLKGWWHTVAEGPFPLVPQHGRDRDEIITYKQLSPDVRVVILKALCEARLDQEDMRAFISEKAKQETSLLSIRKERTGTDMEGATYWYECDPIAGYRLYRELQRSNGRHNGKLRGHLVSAPAVGYWETLATNLDEFQSIADRLCSSKNNIEVILGNRINSDIVPDLLNAEKRKERALKKKLRQASLLDCHFNTESVACNRPRRECKPVSYTFDEYENSINEAIDVMKGLQASRVMADQSSARQDSKEEDDAGRKGHRSAADAGDAGTHGSKSDISLPDCDSDTSSGCHNIEEKAACDDEHLNKRRRAGSLDESDPQSNESEEMNDACVFDFEEENVASRMEVKAGVLNGKGSSHVTMKMQKSPTRSPRVTRSKDEKQES
ncbi:hypothetical protein GOP47_0026711 [Adiantum capillus-veneris]|nr:hypothetical protein GOP47_0026711 [Adiantum capillus-veneris]